MKRRDFVKGLAAATAATTTVLGQQQKTPPTPGANAPAPGIQSPAAQTDRVAQQAAFRTPNIPVTLADVVATTEARYFNATRYATLTRLCEVMMPGGGGYPSALQADTPQFLDFHVSGSLADRQALYNDGLDRLNADSLKQFKIPFAKTDAKQADAVIRPSLKGWINDHPPLEKHARFIAVAHRDIRTATTNSPAWAQAAEASGERTPGVGLYWAPIDPGIEQWGKHGAARAAAAPAAAKAPAHS